MQVGKVCPYVLTQLLHIILDPMLFYFMVILRVGPEQLTDWLVLNYISCYSD